MSFLIITACLLGLVLVAAAYDLNITKNFAIAGKNYATQLTNSYGGAEGIEKECAVSWQGTLTTRTDNDTGVVTMDSASHPFITGNKADIYWQDADGVWYIQKYSSLTVAGTAVTVDTGVTTSPSSNLPVVDTVVYLALVEVYSYDTIGDDSVALLGAADFAASSITLLTTGGTVIELTVFLQPNQNYDWITGSGTNPIAGDVIDTIRLSQADTSTARNVRFVSQVNI